jgi:hypothetical protein
MADWNAIMRGPLTPIQEERHKMLKNRRWFNDNIHDLTRKHPDKWIAVCDEKVVKVGDSYDEILEAVQGKWSLEQALIVKLPFEPEAIYTPV